jgi:SAM-dependent methyltransferase
VAFDSLAGRYDDLFSRSRIGTQREAVWEVLADTFRPGDEILVLNCGTGEDALFLAMLDVSVVACDAPEGMIRTGWNRMQPQAPDAPNPLDLLLTEHLAKLRPGALFDGALSNFSGLHSVADLNQTARDLAALVTMGAPVILCLSSRFCFSETFWFLFHGRFRKAFRRSTGIATVKVGDRAVKIRYPTLRKVKMLFSPFFLMRTCTGIGVVVPPSYLEPIFRKYPRVLGLLRLIDSGISHLPLFRTIGDHMLLYFERVEG